MATNLNPSVGMRVEIGLLEKVLGAMPRGAPNPSIERTNNGGSGLRALASAQPPLFASHLKR